MSAQPRIESNGRFGTKHGLRRHPMYGAWRVMWQRCTDPGCKDYPHYGGRGITVCERWRDFALFLADMGEKPSPRHSIDRKDNNLGYEPDNCRWATQAEQVRNQRVTKVTVELAATIAAECAAGDVSQTTVATKYGIGMSTVSRIARGKHWALKESK